jgi:protein-disulfide isomerase
MTVNRPAGQPAPSKNSPPTSRRSARQQRIASREANRNLSRAGTSGSSGGGAGPLLAMTGIAVIVGIIVILAAVNLTASKTPSNGLPDILAPTDIIPATIATSGHTLGSADAKVTIDLWSDFQCPYCGDFYRDEEAKIVSTYITTGKAKLVWHDEAIVDSIVGHGTESLDAANASRCAMDQGKFWLYHNWLYANQYTEGTGSFTKDRLKTIGQKAGLDMSTFGSCVDNGTHDAEVRAETASAPVNSDGQHGTPTILVNGKLTTDFSLAVVSAAIDSALGIAPSPSPSTSAAPTASGSIAPTASPTAAPASVAPSASAS